MTIAHPRPLVWVEPARCDHCGDPLAAHCAHCNGCPDRHRGDCCAQRPAPGSCDLCAERAEDERQADAYRAQARYLGADAAMAAASWLLLSLSQARSVLDDIDPMVLDAIAEPNLSGEWADDLTPDLLAEEVSRDVDGRNVSCTELVNDIAEAWEEGRDLVWWDAVQGVALRTLGDIPAALRIEDANERTTERLRHRADCAYRAARAA